MEYDSSIDEAIIDVFLDYISNCLTLYWMIVPDTFSMKKIDSIKCKLSVRWSKNKPQKHILWIDWLAVDPF